MTIAVRMVAVVLLVVENSLDLSSEKFKADLRESGMSFDGYKTPSTIISVELL